MPIPIGLVNGKANKPEDNSFLDISFLSNYMPKEAGKILASSSDKDADDLMKIWLNAEKVGSDIFEVKKVDIQNKDLLRLKSRGLISGGTDKVKFTSKGKTVIATMACGEKNKFLGDKKEKSYTEILASMDKRGKKGYRIAKNVYSADSHLLNLKTAEVDPQTFKMKSAVVNQLMAAINTHFSKGQVSPSMCGGYDSFEMMDEALGTCWINVNYIDERELIHIDKYYESESMNDMRGKIITIPFSPLGTPLVTVEAKVIKAIEELLIE